MQLFAIRSEASVLRMLEGSPDEFIHQPILKYLGERGVKHHTLSKILEIRCILKARSFVRLLACLFVSGGKNEGVSNKNIKQGIENVRKITFATKKALDAWRARFLWSRVSVPLNNTDESHFPRSTAC